MGIRLPDKCLRGDVSPCQPLSQVKSDDGVSFICCGLTDREFDPFTLCWKNDDIDEESQWDNRDLVDTASVILQALSAHANMKANNE